MGTLYIISAIIGNIIDTIWVGPLAPGIGN